MDLLVSPLELNKHLPGMPAEQEVLEERFDEVEMQTMQQQEIEELTLYTIAQQKKIEALEKQLLLLLGKIESHDE
ncbi:MAG: hypothetical protein WD077_07765 [Bacteroidia bacterium]